MVFKSNIIIKSYVGGVGGSSLRNINEGTLKIVTMILCIRIKNSNSLLSIVGEDESKKKLGRRKLSKLPIGIAMLPNAVAVPLYKLYMLLLFYFFVSEPSSS